MHKVFDTNILFSDISLLNDDFYYQKALNKISNKQKLSIEAKKLQEDRLLSLGALLLANILIAKMAIDGELYHDANGKPHIGSDEAYISITHCYPYVAVVISPYPCGIDIETESVDFRQIVKHYYTPEEKAYLAQNNDDQRLITKLWCRKECYIKYDKPQDLRTFSVVNPPDGYQYISFELPAYAFEVLIKDLPFIQETISIDNLFNGDENNRQRSAR